MVACCNSFYLQDAGHNIKQLTKTIGVNFINVGPLWWMLFSNIILKPSESENLLQHVKLFHLWAKCGASYYKIYWTCLLCENRLQDHCSNKKLLARTVIWLPVTSHHPAPVSLKLSVTSLTGLPFFTSEFPTSLIRDSFHHLKLRLGATM